MFSNQSFYFLFSFRAYHKIGNDMHIALVKWAPLTDDLIYILDNDIYYMRFSNNGFNDVQRVTYDGITGIVYNGVPDWVYEGNSD